MTSSAGERLVRANGVELCVETFGDRGDPPILLIAGASCSMDWWEEEFCERLAAGPRFVVRYDHRDTGRSVSYEPGAPPYTLRDLAEDAVGLLAALDLGDAHLVGMSMGGWICQLVALDHPDRVASLTLISTTPDLPEVSEDLQAVSAEVPAESDWSDREAVIEYIVEGERPMAGSLPFEGATMRDIAARVYDRTANIAASMTNHFVIDSRERWRGRLGEIGVPTLIIHGTEDPLFPYGNAVALAEEIPGARLLPLKRVGHEVPPRAVWDVVVPAMLEHTTAGPRLATLPTERSETEEVWMSLSNYQVSAGFAVSDMGRARNFYEEKLGLRVGTDSGDNVSYECAGGTAIYVYLSPEHAGKSTATLAGWHVEDAERVVDELTVRGVVFEQYDEGPIITNEKGIADFEGGARVAYFKDPDGNTLSIAQAPRS